MVLVVQCTICIAVCSRPDTHPPTTFGHLKTMELIIFDKIARGESIISISYVWFVLSSIPSTILADKGSNIVREHKEGIGVPNLLVRKWRCREVMWLVHVHLARDFGKWILIPEFLTPNATLPPSHLSKKLKPGNSFSESLKLLDKS